MSKTRYISHPEIDRIQVQMLKKQISDSEAARICGLPLNEYKSIVLGKKKYDGDRIASMVLTIESIVNGES